MDTPKIMDKFAETSKQSLDIRTSHGKFKKNKNKTKNEKLKKRHGEFGKVMENPKNVMDNLKKSWNIRTSH